MRHWQRAFLCSAVIVLSLCSCVNTKRATYFNELSDTDILYKAESLEPIIQKNDLLNITVSSLNTEANQAFNLYSVSLSLGNPNSGTITQTTGYLVDQQGFIQFPMLGRLQVSGLTKKQLRDTIYNGLVSHNYLYEPIVNVRYLNYKVTVLGEVAHPAVFNVPSEKITLLEALGLAGDLTMYGQRNNVLLIREESEGKRKSYHIDLNSKDVLTSPYYYLRSNDVIYVAPSKANVANTSAARVWLPAVLAGLSFVVVVLDKVIN